MVNIGVAEDIPELKAQEIIKALAINIPKIKHIPPPNGIDVGGNVNTTSRQHIETVVYYDKNPNLSILMEGIQNIFTANGRVATILDCKAPENISQQLQFDDVLGLSQNDIMASVVASVAPSLIRVTNFHFSPNRLTKGNNITTGAACRMTITRQKGIVIPNTFVVPSWSGMDRKLTYKRLFPYTNQLAEIPSDSSSIPLPKELTTPSASTYVQNSLYKTIMCRQTLQEIACLYGKNCQFAHGEEELRKKQSGNSPTSDVTSKQAESGIPTNNLPTIPLAHVVKHLTGQLGHSPLSPITVNLEVPINIVPGNEEDPFSSAKNGKGKGNHIPVVYNEQKHLWVKFLEPNHQRIQQYPLWFSATVL